MGHYDPNASSLMASKDPKTGYDHFKSHCSAERLNTELVVTEAIRSTHPDCHVTSISGDDCDLLGYARAGHMNATLKTEGYSFQSERTYNPPNNRLEDTIGDLGDRVGFGHYGCEFQGRSFEAYAASWFDRYFGTTKKYYILSPKSEADAAGHSATVDRFLLLASKWTSELHEEIYVFDAGDWDKNKKLWSAVQTSFWDDVILDPVMKETLVSDVTNFFDSRAVYEEYAVPWKRGIIFHGTPGCGKTISIKALMNTLDKRDQPVASLYVKSFKTCAGEEYSIREIFSKARTMAPCLLIFEDLDSLVVDKVRSYFLNEVDGLEDNNGILMIGSTNHLERLDPGISKRPSRFDRKYHFKLPAETERVQYCRYWKKKLEKNSKIEFDDDICTVVAKLTEGFSYAYLKELFVQTLLTIVGGREHELVEPELEKVADTAEVVDGSTRLAVGEEKVESSDEKPAEADAVPAAKSAEHKMPEVEVPEHLVDNSLLRILRKQLVALWKDMDNTSDNDEEGQGAEDDSEGGDGEASKDYKMQIRMLRRQRNRARNANR